MVAVRPETTVARLDAASPANPAVGEALAPIKEILVVRLALALPVGIVVESEHATQREENAARMGTIAKLGTTVTW